LRKKAVLNALFKRFTELCSEGKWDRIKEFEDASLCDYDSSSYENGIGYSKLQERTGGRSGKEIA
jgi:hypothetical protein